MNRLPLFLFVPMLLALCTPALAQDRGSVSVTIRGTIADSLSGRGIGYATASLADTTGRIVTAAAADAEGRFTLTLKQSGRFVLTASSLGYTPANTPVEADGTRSRIEAGVLHLVQGVELEQVTVAVKRPLVRTDVDKMIYSVEADPESGTGTLSEILRKVPQLSIDGEDNVLLNGKSDYKVLVNGKSSPMMSKNFKEIIKSMPASSIKEIEVMAHPSMKYEADGAGGIINIVTTRKTLNGYTGRVGLNTDSRGSLAGSLYAAAQLGRLNLSASYYGGQYKNPKNTFHTERTNFLDPVNHRIVSDNRSSGENVSHQFSLDASYEIDSLNLLSLSLWGYSGRYTSDGRTHSLTTDSDAQAVQRYFNDSRSRNTWGTISGSLDYQHSFRKKDELLTLSYQFDNSPGRTDYMSSYTGLLDFGTYRESQDNRTDDSEHTFQIDFFNPVGSRHKIEAGAKYILRLNTSDTEIAREQNGEWIDQPQRQNDLDYRQHILGFYGGYTLSLDRFSFKAGFRAEGAWQSGTSRIREGDTEFNARQFNVIPYVNLSFMPGPTHQLQAAYTQRLRRPGIWYLNPYVDDTNPNDIRFGNPDLESVVSHSFSINYSKFSPNWNLFASLYGMFANNDINSITAVRDDGVAETTYANIGHNESYGVNLSGSYRLNTLLSINLGANAGYTLIEAPQQGLRNEGFNFGGNLGLSVTLWKGGRLNAWGGIFSSSVNLQGSGSTLCFTQLGFSQKFLKDKLELSLSLSEPFRGRRSTSYTTEQTGVFHLYGEYSMPVRLLRIGLGFRFGKMEVQVKKTRRSITNDDVMQGKGAGQEIGR